MKLYFTPGACSLAPHIVLHEAGYLFTTEKVDLRTHRTASGEPLTTIHGKNCVPILELGNGERLTEVPVIVQYLADARPSANLIPPAGSMERYRVQEWLNFVTSDLHQSFGPLFQRSVASQDWQQAAERKLSARFDWLNVALAGKTCLVGERFSVADAYLFTVLNWTGFVGFDLDRWPNLNAYLARMATRPKVQDALRAEGLLVKAA
jgi:glutathione S-transferase